jgi:hypothetical protein
MTTTGAPRRPAIAVIAMIRPRSARASARGRPPGGGTAQRRARRLVAQRRDVLGPDDLRRLPRGRAVEQRRADARERRAVAREPAERVELGRLVQRACEAHAAMRGAEAEHPAEGGRRAHRAAGVRAEREIGDARGDGDGRAGGGAARHTAGGRGVARAPILVRLAQDSARELVGVRRAQEARAGGEAARDALGMRGGGPARCRPVRVAGGRAEPRHVEQVLDREVRAGERSARRMRDRRPVLGARDEGAVRVAAQSIRAAGGGRKASV